MASIDFGPLDLTQPDRVRVEDAAGCFPTKWRVHCDQAAGEKFLVTIRDDRNDIRALGSFTAGNVHLVAEFLRAAALQA